MRKSYIILEKAFRSQPPTWEKKLWYARDLNLFHYSCNSNATVSLCLEVSSITDELKI